MLAYAGVCCREALAAVDKLAHPQEWARIQFQVSSVCWRLLAYAGVCWRMLAYAGVCWRMLASAGVCWRLLASASVCWRLLAYAGVCWRLLPRLSSYALHLSYHFLSPLRSRHLET
jgi:hypothetical protein